MLERYHIYKNKKTYDNILNDTFAETENPIFEVIHTYKQQQMAARTYTRTLLPAHSLRSVHLKTSTPLHIFM
jgi:hypothetical protein